MNSSMYIFLGKLRTLRACERSCMFIALHVHGIGTRFQCACCISFWVAIYKSWITHVLLKEEQWPNYKVVISKCLLIHTLPRRNDPILVKSINKVYNSAVPQFVPCFVQQKYGVLQVVCWPFFFMPLTWIEVTSQRLSSTYVCIYGIVFIMQFCLELVSFFCLCLWQTIVFWVDPFWPFFVLRKLGNLRGTHLMGIFFSVLWVIAWTLLIWFRAGGTRKLELLGQVVIFDLWVKWTSRIHVIPIDIK